MKFKLLKGDIEEFALFDEFFPENSSELQIQTGIEVKINIKDERLALSHSVKFENNSDIILKIKSTFYFGFDENTWNDFIKEEAIIIETAKLCRLGEIVVGATRGMLMAKTANTEFSKLILPPIKLGELFQEDLIFNKKSN
ncbi:hypothetical protein [Myroides phaeus]|uniref:Uncharacterized protein n=1 Tax=Myroides phaeus TaxID=702745 RepID=A0A1G8FIJ0_9FLAO|nr:hypothetical protein [Myroides phaeus]SDH81876.1 hypothetical protein SAMN05421818_1174 [Myroides phaeus]